MSLYELWEDFDHWMRYGDAYDLGYGIGEDFDLEGYLFDRNVAAVTSVDWSDPNDPDNYEWDDDGDYEDEADDGLDDDEFFDKYAY